MIPYPMAASSFIVPQFDLDAGTSSPVTYIPPDALLRAPDYSAPFAGLTAQAPMQNQPYYQGAAADDMGIMQEPAIRNALRENFLEVLSGIKSDRARNQKQEAREGYDRFAADILYPLTGLIPGKDNAKNALQASSDLLKSLEDNRKSRSERDRTKQETMMNLGKFIRGADSSDWANVLEREKEARMEIDTRSKVQRRDDLTKENQQKIDLRRESQKNLADHRDAQVQRWQRVDDLGKKRLESQIDNNEQNRQLKMKQLAFQMEHARNIEDFRERELEYKKIKADMDAIEDERESDRKLLMQIEDLKLRTATKNKPDDAPMDYQPPTVDQIKQKSAAPQDRQKAVDDEMKQIMAILEQRRKHKPAPGKKLTPRIDTRVK
jgi:hypothetical protein